MITSDYEALFILIFILALPFLSMLVAGLTMKDLWPGVVIGLLGLAVMAILAVLGVREIKAEQACLSRLTPKITRAPKSQLDRAMIWLVDHPGADGLSMRKAARAAHVSASTLRRAFEALVEEAVSNKGDSNDERT